MANAEPVAYAEGMHTGTVEKAWSHALDDGSGTITAFALSNVTGVFWGPADWLPLLKEAMDLGTRCRILASIPEPEPCGDPLCGDGCCDDPYCTNIPADERIHPFLVRADTIEWL